MNLHNDYSSNVQVRGNDHVTFDRSALSTLPAGKIGLGENEFLRCPPNPVIYNTSIFGNSTSIQSTNNMTTAVIYLKY
jgi:hypothetical protein